MIAARRGSGGRPVVLLDRKVPRGSALAVPRSALPPTAEDEYYSFELVGLEVVEEGGRSLGRVRAVVPGVANDALELEQGALLPLVGRLCARRRSRCGTYPCRARILRPLLILCDSMSSPSFRMPSPG